MEGWPSEKVKYQIWPSTADSRSVHSHQTSDAETGQNNISPTNSGPSGSPPKGSIRNGGFFWRRKVSAPDSGLATIRGRQIKTCKAKELKKHNSVVPETSLTLLQLSLIVMIVSTRGPVASLVKVSADIRLIQMDSTLTRRPAYCRLYHKVRPYSPVRSDSPQSH